MQPRFTFLTESAALAYVAALNAREGFPRKCPARLIAPGTPEAATWTMAAVKIERAGAVWMVDCWPGESVPLGATRCSMSRHPSTGAVTLTPIAEPTARQLADARAAKLARRSAADS